MKNKAWKVVWNEDTFGTYLYGSKIWFHSREDIEFENEITPDEVREILSNSFGIKVIDDVANMDYPTTYDASGVNPVFVGRIRKNLAFKNGISLWCVADNLRIGAALNTVRICKKIIEMELY